MYKFKFIYVLALITLLMSSCRKDISDFIEDPGGKNHAGAIFGIVVDESGSPVKDAKVQYLGQTRLSDENGIYQFKNVNINTKHNLITIGKSGYFEASRVFTTDRSTTVSIKNILLAKTFDQSFETSSGGTLSKGSMKLEFPADAIVYAYDNAPYTGTVRIAMKYLDPSKRDIYTQMPGDLVGINAANQIAGMTSFGMLAVELQTPTGQTLQVASGKKVKMSNKLSSDMVSNSPSTIPLWYYDEAIGYWKEEGEAKLINDTYVGEVGHFTFWNYDSQAPSIIMSGRVVDQNGNPVAGADVWAIAPGGQGGGHGLTNLDGTFSGRVTQGAVLDITVSVYGSGCALTEVYSGQAGPFSADVTIPDIVATLGSNNNIHVTANVVNCNGDPVQNGYVIVSSGGNTISYLAIDNGVVDATVFNCNSVANVTFVAVNSDDLVQSDPVTLSAVNDIDLGTVAACGNLADFLNVEIPDLGIDTALLAGVSITNNNFKHIGAGNGIDSFTRVNFHLYWQENDITTITPGTYPIHPLETNVQILVTPAQYVYMQGTAGSVTITQGGSQPGDVVTGTYDFTGTIAGTVITHQVTGSFRQTLQ